MTDSNPRTTHQSPPTDLRFGAPVVSDSGRNGTINDLVPDAPGSPGGVRVTWDDGTIELVPRDAVSIEGDRIVVRSDQMADGRRHVRSAIVPESEQMATTGGARTLQSGEDVVLPIVEERITAQATWQEAGAVTFRLRTVEEGRAVTAYPAHEELDIAEVPVGRALAEGESVEPRTEGDTTVIPVVEEEPVVVMRRMLVKELRVTKRRVTGERHFDETIRRTIVETETGGLEDRVHRNAADTATGMDNTE